MLTSGCHSASSASVRASHESVRAGRVQRRPADLLSSCHCLQRQLHALSRRDVCIARHIRALLNVADIPRTERTARLSYPSPSTAARR